MKRTRSKGFTLTEVMISVVISIMIFSAMATLLSRCFSMWVEAQAHWKLAQHARVTRTRLLYGGFGIGTGLLNATNVTVNSGSGEGWAQVTFYPVTKDAAHVIFGWQDDDPAQIWIMNNSNQYAWAQTVSRVGISDEPVVMADDFTAAVTNQMVTLTYTLNFSAMGRDFELPQVLTAALVNE